MPHRRDLLRLSAAASAAVLARTRSASAAPDDDARGDDAADLLALVGDGPPPLNRFPRTQQRFFEAKLAANERRIAEQLDGLRTRADAEAHVRALRQKIRRAFGPFPARTPLKPHTAGTVDRGDHVIERLTYESRPGFLVTANLYLPKAGADRITGGTHGDGPYPAVLGLCGHSDVGKADEKYQHFAGGLARLGFACLLIDPAGQGERLQFPDGEGGSEVGVGVLEHIQYGNQLYLVGENLAFWEAWDGIRGIDLLEARDDCSTAPFLGVTGNSGGGTQTTWVTGLDDRVTASAPSCFVTTFLRNLRNELPTDTEQDPPRVVEFGLDHHSFMAAALVGPDRPGENRGPGQVTLLGKRDDFFDVRGTREAYERLTRLADLLGTPDAVAITVAEGRHGYDEPLRLAMYRRFCAAAGLPVPEEEPTIDPLPPEELWATPGGSVSDAGSKPVHAFTAERAKKLAESRGDVRGANLRAAIRDVLRLPDRDDGPPAGSPPSRVLRWRQTKRYPLGRWTTDYALRTDAGVLTTVYHATQDQLQAVPHATDAPAVLYVSHRSADAELTAGDPAADTLKKFADAKFYAVDPRGVGETEPNTVGPGEFPDPYGSDYMYSAHGLMCGTPVLGLRVRDLLRVLDWLAALHAGPLHLVALGHGTVPAALAAVLHDRVGTVTLEQPPPSWTEIARDPRYDLPLSLLPPGVLERFDMPDVWAELGL